jgi:molecular chaperone GrpE (heat shock protein)
MTTIQPSNYETEERTRNRDRTLDQDEEIRETGAEVITASGEDVTAHAADPDAPYLTGKSSAQAGERWQRVQAEFVDDPRKSVSEAHQLVSELVQQIVTAFTHERDNLERQWSEGENVSTEDLRVSLQRYRAFFSRLLPSADGLGKAS